MSNKTIADEDTPDPWMIAAYGKFYLTFTLGNRVEIWESGNMEDFRGCRRSVVWQPAPDSPWSADVWAPELHYLHDKWYIYTCGGQPGIGNPSHRTLVLRSSSPDPMDPAGWTFLGPLQGLPDHWHIDATVFSPDGRDLYCCYSGWPLGDHSDTQQDLFLVKMASPEQAVRESLVCISRASLPWERPEGGRRGVNEGPAWVSCPSFRGIVYSADASWTSDYKLGLLAYVGGDPCKETSWQKRPTPLLACDKSKGGPYGPGHASFLNSPWNDGKLFCVYHATANEGEGWNNRKGRVICMGPECFTSEAQTMCSAGGFMGGGGGGGNGGQGQYPGGVPPAQPPNPQGGPGQSAFGGKFGQQIESHIPGQYKGVYDKMKKFF